MWPLKNIFTPGTQEVSFPVEDNHRMLATMKDVNLVLGVDADSRDIAQLGGKRPQFSATL